MFLLGTKIEVAIAENREGTALTGSRGRGKAAALRKKSAARRHLALGLAEASATKRKIRWADERRAAAASVGREGKRGYAETRGARGGGERVRGAGGEGRPPRRDDAGRPREPLTALVFWKSSAVRGH